MLLNTWVPVVGVGTCLKNPIFWTPTPARAGTWVPAGVEAFLQANIPRNLTLEFLHDLVSIRLIFTRYMSKNKIKIKKNKLFYHQFEFYLLSDLSLAWPHLPYSISIDEDCHRLYDWRDSSSHQDCTLQSSRLYTVFMTGGIPPVIKTVHHLKCQRFPSGLNKATRLVQQHM
jgi:hypothetical protein